MATIIAAENGQTMDAGKKITGENKRALREEKQRDSKIEESLLKSMANCQTIEEKFSTLLKKTIESEKDNRKLLHSQKQHEKYFEALKREKENLQSDYNKAVLTKSKLESLCRELQRQNKTIKDENFSKIREEEEKRKETQGKFQKSLNEIQALMNDNNEKNQKLKEDNTEMSKRFQFLLEQYELRDQQMEKINKQMDLMTQLNEAKMAKASLEGAAEREKILEEKTELMTELHLVKKQLLDLQATEKMLQDQINMYSEKYGEFQSSLQRSHLVFTGYKTDMEKMSKKTSKMEKEILLWKSKFEKTNVVALELASEKQYRDQFIAKTTRQLAGMQKLNRCLQSERSTFLAKLKEHDIEIPNVPAVAVLEDLPFEENIHKGPDKLDVMTKNCNELKNNLAQLQSQLTQLKSSDPTGAVVPPEAKKPKHKNKKSKAKEAAEADLTVPTAEPKELTSAAVFEPEKEPLSLEATTCSAQIVEVIDEVPKTNGDLKSVDTMETIASVVAPVVPNGAESTQITTEHHTELSNPPELVVAEN